jgi:hypothetical protein
MRKYLEDVAGLRDPYGEEYLERISPSFYAAAWSLCHRGILRPGVTRYMAQATDDGSGGNGYSVTPWGHEWLQEPGEFDYVPVEPGRFAQLLDRFSPRFGPGFRERAHEAMRCYGANAHLACCAMCGAAAESILIRLAVQKSSDEPQIMKEYLAAGGRGRVENRVLGRQDKRVQEEMRGYLSLLKYWRDATSHGRVTGITDNEAYTSLAILLRLAQFSDERWDELTRP